MQKIPKEDLENTQIINTYMHINSCSPLKFVQLPLSVGSNLDLGQRGEAGVNCGQIRKEKKKRQKSQAGE